MQLCTEVHVQNIKILRLYYHIRQHKPNNTHIHSFIHSSIRPYTLTHTHIQYTHNIQHRTQHNTTHRVTWSTPHPSAPQCLPRHPLHQVLHALEGQLVPDERPRGDGVLRDGEAELHSAVRHTHGCARHTLTATLSRSFTRRAKVYVCGGVGGINCAGCFLGEDKGRNFLLFTCLNMYGTVLHGGVDNGNNNKYI